MIGFTVVAQTAFQIGNSFSFFLYPIRAVSSAATDMKFAKSRQLRSFYGFAVSSKLYTGKFVCLVIMFIGLLFDKRYQGLIYELTKLHPAPS